MNRDDALQIENQVRVTLREGGDCRAALAWIDRVVAAYPKGTHSLALRAMVLERLGRSPETERALVASFEAGLAPPRAEGEASVITIVHPTLELARYLDAEGRRPDAVAVIERALGVVAHEHASSLFQARERLTGVAGAGTESPSAGHDPCAGYTLLTYQQLADHYGVKVPTDVKPPERRGGRFDTDGIGSLVLVGVGSLVVIGGLIRLVLYLITGN